MTLLEQIQKDTQALITIVEENKEQQDKFYERVIESLKNMSE